MTSATASTMNGVRSSSLAEASQSLVELIHRREKELDVREQELEQRELVVNKAIGDSDDSDVLELNIGGTVVTVFRKTLTQFNESMLAAKFSGRWDDSLAKDRHGRFFLDHDPHTFLQVIDFLRDNVLDASDGPPAPMPTAKLDRLLDHYGLTFALYPIKVRPCGLYDENTTTFLEAFSTISSTPLSYTVTTDDGSCGTYDIAVGALRDRKIRSFTVEVGLRTKRFLIGWRSAATAVGIPLSNGLEGCEACSDLSYMDIGRLIRENNPVRQPHPGLPSDLSGSTRNYLGGSRIVVEQSISTKRAWTVKGYDMDGAEAFPPTEIACNASLVSMGNDFMASFVDIPVFSLEGTITITNVKYEAALK